MKFSLILIVALGSTLLGAMFPSASPNLRTALSVSPAAFSGACPKQNVSDTWRLNPPNRGYGGWEAIRIISPQLVTSARAHFILDCLIPGQHLTTPIPPSPIAFRTMPPLGPVFELPIVSAIYPVSKSVAGSCPIGVAFNAYFSLRKGEQAQWPSYFSYVFMRSDGSRSAVFKVTLPNPFYVPPGALQDSRFVIFLLFDSFLAGRSGLQQDTLHMISPALADTTATVSVNCSPPPRPSRTRPPMYRTPFPRIPYRTPFPRMTPPRTAIREGKVPR